MPKQKRLPEILHEGEDYILVKFNECEFEITGVAITLVKSIIHSLKSISPYDKGLKQLRADARKFLREQETDCGCADAFDTNTTGGYANYLINKFINLTS